MSHNCFNFLIESANIGGAVDSDDYLQALEVYELWRKYCPIHHSLYQCRRDVYPCLTFHPDSSITIEDIDSDIDWSGSLGEAIAMLNTCVNSKISFAHQKMEQKEELPTIKGILKAECVRSPIVLES